MSTAAVATAMNPCAVTVAGISAPGVHRAMPHVDADGDSVSE